MSTTTKPIPNYSFFTMCPETVRASNKVKIDYTVHRGNPRLPDKYLEVHAIWELLNKMRSNGHTSDFDASKWRAKLIHHDKMTSDEFSVTVKVSKK